MNDADVKQVLFKLKCEIEDKNDDVIEAMNVLYKKGRRVGFKNGRGICRGIVHSVGDNRFCFEINIIVDSSGNHKWFHHCLLAELN